MARLALKQARKAKGMTQDFMATHLSVNPRHYKKIESGESLGSIEIWDKLEDFFNLHQRLLREVSNINPVQEGNRL